MDVPSRKQELLSSATNDQNLRTLLGLGLLDFLADDEATSDFLQIAFSDDIEDHIKERCRCDLTDGGYGFCYIGQWYEGCRNAWELIAEMEADYVISLFKKHFVTS